MKLNIDFSELRDCANRYCVEKIEDNDYATLIAFFLRNQIPEWDSERAFKPETLQLYDGYLEIELPVI